MADTLESQLAALSAVTQKLTEAYRADAERLRAERERSDAEFQARMKELAQQSQQAEQAAFSTGLASWDLDQLGGRRGWAKPDIELVKSLTPADIEALSAEQLYVISSHGKEYAAAVQQATSRAITEAQAAENPTPATRQADPRLAAALEQMTADELYRAMTGPQGYSIIQVLGDIGRA